MPETNRFSQEALARLVCRPALPKDTPDVIDLTRRIWDGHDYVPQVWGDWLADPEGLLAVAEWGGRVVGLYKLSLLSAADWWLEGLRVHPEYEGRGIASRLHHYLVGIWQHRYGGALRLATASYQAKVHHLCERTGFRKVCEVTEFLAPAAGSLDRDPVGEDPGAGAFTPLQPGELSRALAAVLDNPLLPLCSGLVDLGWQWSGPDEAHLVHAVEHGQAWWWRGGEGLLAIWVDTEKAEHRPFIQVLACPLEKAAQALQDYLRLAARLGYAQAGWFAPLQPELLPVLSAAGFERGWDDSLYIFEKRIG